MKLFVSRIVGLILLLSITIVAYYVFSTSYTTSANYDDDHHHNHRQLRVTQTTTTNQTYSNRSLQIQLEKTTYKIPHQLEHLIDWTDIPQTSTAKATPIFWHILKSGGTTVKLMYAQCYGLVEACETGMLENVWYDSSTGNNNVPDPMEWIQQQQQQQFNGNDNQRRLEHMESAGDENVYGTAGGVTYAPEGDSTFEQQQQPNNVDEESQLYAPVQQSEEIIPAEEERVREAQEYNAPGDNPPQIEGHLEGSVLSAPEPQQQQQQQQQDSDLKIVISGDGRKYVNVDVTTSEGIIQASQRGFATSNLADIIFTPLLLEASELLLNRDTNKGRMFALFRHPIERLTSIFYYLQKATWEPTYDPQLAQMTIDDYARSEKCESNWLVRSLVGQMTGSLNSDSLEIAKEVLRQKCLVGFMDEMEESIERFHSYFGFGDDTALECAKTSFTRKGSSQSNKNKHPPLDGESETYAILAKKNELDILLYFYAKDLFDEQKKLFT